MQSRSDFVPNINGFVCLANSRKHSGRCLAGKAQNHEGTWIWVRPVGTSVSREITEQDRQYANGNRAAVLDVINIAIQHRDDHQFQAENILIDPGQHWVHTSSRTTADLRELEDHPATLWENGHSSTSGVNDRVPESILITQRQTLFLIRPETVRFSVGAEGIAFNDNRRSVRAHFCYRGVNYALKVTDPAVEQYYLSQNDGTYENQNVSFFTISLSDIYNGHAYKLVAAAF